MRATGIFRHLCVQIEVSQLAKRDYYEVLGVDRSVDEAALKRRTAS